jgi:hypothetical protein
MKAFSFSGLLALALSALTASAQTPVWSWGSVNGVPLPASAFASATNQASRVFERMHGRGATSPADIDEVAVQARNIQCGHLRSAVADAARARALVELGVRVNQADLDLALKQIHPGDPVAAVAATREHAALIEQALAAVYDQAQPAGQVYQTLLATKGISQQEWSADLETGRTREGRTMLARGLTATPAEYSKGVSAAQQTLAASTKLDGTIDSMLAAKDPVFDTYLKHWEASRPNPDSTFHSLPTNEKDYLDRAVAAWWKGELSKQTIVLSDPSLVSACALANMDGSQAVRSRH